MPLAGAPNVRGQRLDDCSSGTGYFESILEACVPAWPPGMPFCGERLDSGRSIPLLTVAAYTPLVFYRYGYTFTCSKGTFCQATDSSARKEHPLQAHYEMLLAYLGWTDAGRVIAPGVWPAGAVSGTAYPQKAYELGHSL